MFTILQLKNSQPLNQACQQYIRETLNKFSLTTDGLWLRTLKIDTVQFKWCPAMQQSDILGAFCPVSSDTVYIQPHELSVNLEQDAQTQLQITWLQSIFSTVVHQLRHMYQWRKNKFSYTLASLPLLRQVTLQRDAQRVQVSAQLFAQREAAIRNQKRNISKGWMKEVAVGSDSNA